LNNRFTPHDCVSEGLLLLSLYSKSDGLLLSNNLNSNSEEHSINSIEDVSNELSLGFVRRSDYFDGLLVIMK